MCIPWSRYVDEGHADTEPPDAPLTAVHPGAALISRGRSRKFQSKNQGNEWQIPHFNIAFAKENTGIVGNYAVLVPFLVDRPNTQRRDGADLGQSDVVVPKDRGHDLQQGRRLEHGEVGLAAISAHEPALRPAVGAAREAVAIRRAAVAAGLVRLPRPRAVDQAGELRLEVLAHLLDERQRQHAPEQRSRRR